jgi:hypothetical protein
MRLPRTLSLAACALAVSGCAQNTATLGDATSRPKMVVVSDFVVASEITATDNGFNMRLERAGGNYPILERRQRALARVNDEIVAVIIADVTAADLEARPGNAQSLAFGDYAVLVTGRLRPPEHKALNQVGFGPGRGNAVAEMTLMRYSGGGRVPITDFTTDIAAGRKIPAGNAQAIAARNQAIAAALVVENALPEKLSPDVEAQARALGRAIAQKIVATIKERDWIPKPEGAEAAPRSEQQMRLPEARLEPKPAAATPTPKKPQGDPLAPEDEEPPDTGPLPGQSADNE